MVSNFHSAQILHQLLIIKMKIKKQIPVRYFPMMTLVYKHDSIVCNFYVLIKILQMYTIKNVHGVLYSLQQYMYEHTIIKYSMLQHFRSEYFQTFQLFYDTIVSSRNFIAGISQLMQFSLCQIQINQFSCCINDAPPLYSILTLRIWSR